MEQPVTDREQRVIDLLRRNPEQAEPFQRLMRLARENFDELEQLISKLEEKTA